ncbi:hypothetical protein GLI01_33970 [Gluconacetobacter liquefaciens]|nr:hypothetical protein AA0522_0355 [Gluconacetobacter liquefaciens NRIC 0522]GEB39362.1 hypothetical protein GLI01_33970 [Gluconacetobacter liquefaciens]
MTAKSADDMKALRNSGDAARAKAFLRHPAFDVLSRFPLVALRRGNAAKLKDAPTQKVPIQQSVQTPGERVRHAP